MTEYQQEYEDIKKSYKDFLSESERFIARNIEKSNIELAFPITSRLKELDSIKEKHESGRYKIKKSLAELEDLVGLRIVVLFPDDKQKIVDLIRKEFHIEKERNLIGKGIDRFGYSSYHLIIKPNENWKKVPPWNEHYEKLLEVQVRTLSEHIWAETSHNLFYKVEENIPHAIRRRLSQLSALLEVADEKLQNVKESVLQYVKDLEQKDYDEIVGLDLNPFTLKRVYIQYFEDSKKEDLLVFQKINKTIEKSFSISTVKHLDAVLKTQKIEAKSFEQFNVLVIKVLEEDMNRELENQKKKRAQLGKSEP